MKITNISFGVCVLLVFESVCTHASNENVQKRFDKCYKAWKSSIEEQQQQLAGCLANEKFYTIIDLGIPAIPFIIEKIEENPEVFHLAGAVNIISKRTFAKSEWPRGKLGDSITAAQMYVQWWKEGRFKTGEKFSTLYTKWKDLKAVHWGRTELSPCGCEL